MKVIGDLNIDSEPSVYLRIMRAFFSSIPFCMKQITIENFESYSPLVASYCHMWDKLVDASMQTKESAIHLIPTLRSINKQIQDESKSLG